VPISLETYAGLRPYLYHITTRSNLPWIRAGRALESAASLAAKADASSVQRARREVGAPSAVGAGQGMLGGHSSLHARNAQLEEGWTFERFLAHLNERVFFWPGRDVGPIHYGWRHFARDESKGLVIIRASFADVLHANSQPPMFARGNVGSPRWSGGPPPVRGSRSFSSADDASFDEGDVVEVAFQGRVVLPASAQVSDRLDGGWMPL